jgi:hypothetical protein
MGGGSSKAVTTNENNQTIVNKNQIKLLNDQLNSVMAKTTINNSTGCKSEVNQNQVMDLSGCKAGGDLNITDVEFKQEVVVDFKCIQVSKVQNEIARDIMTNIMAQIESNMDTESINKMNAVAKANTKTGFAGFAPSDSSSATHNKYNLNVTNDNTTDIQNIIKNVINVEFKVEDIQECISTVMQNQEINAKNCDIGGDINITNIKFDQAVNAMVQCIQQKGISNKITDILQTGLGVVTTTETATKADVEQTGESEATSESKGPVGEVVGGIGDGIGGIFGGIFGGLGESLGGSGESLGMDSLTTGIIVCCVIILLLVLSGAAVYVYQSLPEDERPRYGRR